MAIEYFELNTDGEFGQAKMSLDSFEDIATQAAIKIKGVYIPKKVNDIVNVKFKDNEIVVEISVKLIQGIDIAKTCQEIQNNIYTSILEMTNVKCKEVNIDITGFIQEKDN